MSVSYRTPLCACSHAVFTPAVIAVDMYVSSGFGVFGGSSKTLLVGGDTTGVIYRITYMP